MLKGTPQQKQLAFNALGQLAANIVQPQIMPQGIDTSYSGVGLGNINLGTASGIGNYGTGYVGSPIPDPYSQLQGFDYVDNQYAASKPMIQDMYATQRENRLLDFQTQAAAQWPWLQKAASSAPAQQQRLFGAQKGSYYDRMGMAAMASAAAAAAQGQRAFGRQGFPNTPNFA